MNSKEYILKNLDNLINQFSNLKLRYEFHEFENAHYIEVLPKKEFETNEKYAEFETNLIVSFAEQFPYDEINFITEGDFIEISKPFIEKYGILYNADLELLEMLSNSEMLISTDLVSFSDNNEIFQTNNNAYALAA